MEEVLQMLNTGDTAAVVTRMKSFPEGSGQRDEADFYGDFYLGLYADASGDTEKAAEFLNRAAKDAPHHYMGDVARVYAKHLSK